MVRPNIVFLMPDQLRWDYLSCYGADFIDTPHIDAIGSAGVRFDRAYSASPLCVPARTALLTGMSVARTGVADNLRALRPDYQRAGIRTWPQLLGAAGYATAAIGKMHFYPWDASHGFEHRTICEDKLWSLIQDDYHHYLQRHGLAKMRWERHEYGDYLESRGAARTDVPWQHSWDRFTGREACRFIAEYRDERPFAVMVGFPGPHDPYDPASDFAVQYREEDMPPALAAADGDPGGLCAGHRRQRAGMGMSDAPLTTAEIARFRTGYAGLVKQIDHEVGAIVDALRDRGVLDDTVLIFASDHGDLLGDHGLQGKGSYYEGSMHVPLLVRGPGVSAGGDCAELVELRDVTATMLQAAGVALPPYMDAQPLPALGSLSDRSVAPREAILGTLADAWCAFDGTWKLCKYLGHPPLLFDLDTDPQELRDRSADPAATDVLRRLDSLLTTEVMAATSAAMSDRVVAPVSLALDEPFGRPGWDWQYPAPIHPDPAG